MRPVGKFGLQLSVVVTTYNNPRALSLVLASLQRQSVQEFELLIADDGSGPETKAVVDGAVHTMPLPIRHVWHPDEGFRKCTILNRAVLAATGNYLIFLDGDCIAPSHCIAAHVRAARPATYLAGGKVLLTDGLSRRITVDMVARGDFDRVGWWWRDVRKSRRLMVSRMPGIRALLDRKEHGWRGENSSTFAEYIHRVGGFDERFTYGLEDADFGHRLVAAGIRGRSLRYTAPVFHLEHARPYVRPEEVAANRALYDANRAARATVTPYGLPGARASTLPAE